MYSEKAVTNFYEWEQLGRGYLLFPYQIDLEPTYHKFYHSYGNDEYVDDGKVPLFSKFLFPKKKPIVEEELEIDFPDNCQYSELFRQFNISFPASQDFDNSETIEFLNMLSDSGGQISFEIIGKHNSIEIQIVCNQEDYKRILNLLKAYFPNFIISESVIKQLPFDNDNEVLIVDFGYNEEFMRPINSSIDSLKSFVAVLDNLNKDEVVMLQIIFKGVKNPWVNSILDSVNIGSNSFFPESPEMAICAKEKVSLPLFTVVFRLAVQSQDLTNARNLANELILNIKSASRSEFNSLIPLHNEGYEYELHYENLKERRTNRFGMIMNSQEMLSFIHFPDSPKLINSDRKTKAVPNSLINNDYLIGVNNHFGIEKEVTLNDSQRLRHCHIIGATGTGKSTLILNLFLEDIKKGNGCVIFDPHGDTIDEIIPQIPTNRLNDVILIDPSDNEFSFGFNLLSAKTEVEKIVLSSDLVGAFRRHSTSWGDQMTSILSNAINAFLDSNKGGTLIELKRFLLEESFRKDFLKSVEDRSIHYYWNNDFNLLKKGGISPLLTRLDTFLRPKTIRYILSQKEGLDFNDVLNERRILLVKLSQGLIGEENSYLLGTLILSKIYQVAQARQQLSKKERHPFYIYLDEFQNFITPSINSILSGARKYGIGLVLAHQELNQIKDQEIGNSVLSNANIRFCFRLGDFDARKLESGFSYFDSNDLQNLNIGEAIVRVGRSSDDFSLNTFLLNPVDENDNSKIIIENSRKNYSKRIFEIEDKLNDLLPETDYQEPVKNRQPEQTTEPNQDEKLIPNLEEKGKEYLERLEDKEVNREHRYLQSFIKKIAEQRGFKATIEETVENGRVDVSLKRDSLKIACEIAVSNSVTYEIKNIQKCLSSDYSFVCIISKNKDHLYEIKKKSEDLIKKQTNVHFYTPDQIVEFLDSLNGREEKEVKRIKGYRVKVNYRVVSKTEPNQNYPY